MQAYGLENEDSKMPVRYGVVDPTYTLTAQLQQEAWEQTTVRTATVAPQSAGPAKVHLSI